MIYLKKDLGDTFEDLAKIVGLDRDEHEKWPIPLAIPVGSESPESGCRYLVPNNLINCGQG